MRIHGTTTVKRRIYHKKIDQKNAREMLKEDFGGLFGYCGKNGRFLHEHFHVDHFVPQTVDEDRIQDYSNFVWACPKCNLVKSKKWPTQDKSVPHQGDIGFIDPASEEFDQHLFRDDEGRIRGRTALGEQMCRLLNFHLRRTEFFWKVEQLCHQMEQLEQKRQKQLLNTEELNFYMDMNILLKEILDDLYEQRE